ncbi:hypothetical protein Ahy_B08g090241 [Arachis hypogaea]|uniref:Uncharacterized protein n=1 Tax=Arachis hypogaea TaxID=3818 RepID=A0A444XZU3_ARAHY|nr:hypothetical protein Ahy_B08g090241 [Arachis hypogaea]
MNPQAYILLLAFVIVGRATVNSTNDKDKEECTQQLGGLATCLPYVGGELLHMDPKSPEAQVFYQSEKNGTSPVAPAPFDGVSPVSGKGQSKGKSSQETSSAQKNEALWKDKKLFGLAILGFGLQIVGLFFRL